MPSKDQMCKKAQSAFFLGFQGYTLTASRAGVDTPTIFVPLRGCKNACWEPSQSLLSASPPLPLLFLVLLSSIRTQQIVYIRLDCHHLPHFFLSLLVFGIELFLFFCQLPALLFQNLHLGQLGSTQQFVHGSLGRLVSIQLCLMFHQIFLAVLGSLIAIKDRSVLCILHHS